MAPHLIREECDKIDKLIRYEKETALVLFRLKPLRFRMVSKEKGTEEFIGLNRAPD